MNHPQGPIIPTNRYTTIPMSSTMSPVISLLHDIDIHTCRFVNPLKTVCPIVLTPNDRRDFQRTAYRRFPSLKMLNGVFFSTTRGKDQGGKCQKDKGYEKAENRARRAFKEIHAYKDLTPRIREIGKGATETESD